MAKVLVIDDSRFSRLKITQCLNQGSHEVIEAENGLKGLDMVREHEPDCVLCDILMPVMDGYTFLERIRDRKISVPVIIMTADIQDTTRKRVIDLGAVKVINKPPAAEVILAAVDSALTRRSDHGE